ncbi:hypothetical protein SSX86_013619 [Deinandra increscens subsp. villosa]|uniref:SWIM-type domain-containing protein n=1 Tax=Deinandra increscens subsp. villosa TaxID=3103831 RepID=A0AAP0GWV8_9ASTR
MSDDFLVRQALSQKDVDIIYATGYDTLFTIRLHHGGKFTKFPSRCYVKGKIDHVDMVDTDKFSVHELDTVMLRLGYTCNEAIYYHFLEPGKDLDYGLQALASDFDVLKMTKNVPQHRVISVYTEHGASKLPIVSLSHIRIEDVSESSVKDTVSNVKLGVKNSNPNTKLLEWKEHTLDDIDFDDLFSYEKQVETTPPVNDAALIVNQNAHVVNQMVNEEGDGKNDKDIAAVNDAAVIVNQNAHVVNQMVNEEGDGKNDEDIAAGDSECDGKNDEDSDYIVDDENNMGDYEVDMRDFNLNVDSDVDDVLEDNEDNDDLEDEVLDNDTFDDIDKNGNTIRKHTSRNANTGTINFYLGQVFGTKEECKKLIRAHSVETRRNIRIIKDEDERVRAICKGHLGDIGSSSKGPEMQKQKCKGAALDKDKTEGDVMQKDKGKGVLLEEDKGKGQKSAKNLGGRGKKTNPHQYQCPWVLLLAKAKDADSWMIRTLVVDHNCLPLRSIYSCTSNYLSQKILNQIAENPSIPVKAVQEQLQRELQLRVSKMKAYRAKAMAKAEIHGDYFSQYSLLRDYVQELKSKNPGTTVKIEVDPVVDPSQPTRRFKRIYICLGALKRGFKAIGRDLLGLDGAFMKGPYPGQILSAVGIDPNNGIYPVCYAIVETENLDSWTWFLQCLGEDLDLTSRSNFTFISDRQKGLLPAMANVYPSAEHRFCLRHIHENFGLFHLNIGLDLILLVSRAISDVLLNNMCEVFNGKISEGRDKPIISALEYIREYLMRRIVIVLKHIERSEGLLTPTISKMFEQIKKDASNYLVSWNGDDQYQVSSPHEQVVVNLAEKCCACRRWEITGIPCRHVVAAIWEKTYQKDDVSQLLKWVNPIYTMERWKEVYSHRINPLNGRAMWEKSDLPTVLTPPTHHVQVGRPKKARKRSAGEMDDISSGRMSKKNMTIKCGKCGNMGHNQRTCKGQTQVKQAAGGVRSRSAAKQGQAATVSDSAHVGGVAQGHGAAGGVANEGAAGGVSKQHACSNCGGKGHNKKTCKSKVGNKA